MKNCKASNSHTNFEMHTDLEDLHNIALFEAYNVTATKTAQYRKEK